jgi:hypothetical protein
MACTSNVTVLTFQGENDDKRSRAWSTQDVSGVVGIRSSSKWTLGAELKVMYFQYFSAPLEYISIS